MALTNAEDEFSVFEPLRGQLLRVLLPNDRNFNEFLLEWRFRTASDVSQGFGEDLYEFAIRKDSQLCSATQDAPQRRWMLVCAQPTWTRRIERRVLLQNCFQTSFNTVFSDVAKLIASPFSSKLAG